MFTILNVDLSQLAIEDVFFLRVTTKLDLFEVGLRGSVQRRALTLIDVGLHESCALMLA
jgi:hypothetical protein